VSSRRRSAASSTSGTSSPPSSRARSASSRRSCSSCRSRSTTAKTRWPSLLIQKKDELTTAIESLSAELKKVSDQAEDAKAGLLQFQGEIEKLKREKEKMIAAKANAEARIEIQETLDGLSTDADVKALDNVREHISKLQAEADIGSEIKGESLDTKLKKIKEKAAQLFARAASSTR
jgi:phage shock protein A